MSPHFFIILPRRFRMGNNTLASVRASESSASPRAMTSDALPPSATGSFKEMQRMHAMRMELFGFGGWVASAFCYVLFLIWAYVPETTLRSYGWTYFPSKHWAVAVPAIMVMTYVFSLVLYKATALLSTPRLGSYATILDTHTVPLPEGATYFDDDTEATPGIGDISIFETNRHFFASAWHPPAKHVKEA
ncbi:hypothetical protein PsorP6_013092 [Peronosclerospora sorghi]|uniref:Uncharacterized protein n=1 Tax=Peronosclerospora sorghi TaxID=230839 RepID=A0ACC0WJF9_9STRA|nr:hypothetical protein PsorP6_013092 [Peronosclerospora sorghi]